MAEYIEREALLKFIEENNTDSEWMVNQYNADWIYSFIDSAPAADVAEVKHGEWVVENEYSIRCSECCFNRAHIKMPMDYCPNCGSRMDGKGKK